MSTQVEPNVIQRFYTAFQRKDYRTMQECYADEATFFDPVFQHLTAAEVRAMWEMFCTSGADIHIEFDQVNLTEQSGSAQWTAKYVFSATGNSVVNRIQATFSIRNGKFLQHKDDFNFSAWARQALGWKGWLLGWTPFLQNKVRSTARKNLDRFMTRQNAPQ